MFSSVDTLIGRYSSNFPELSILDGHIIFTEHEDGRKHLNRDLDEVLVEL